MNTSDLIGAWTLDCWHLEIAGQLRGYPFGEDAQGQIVYGKTQMSAILSRTGRTPLPFPDLTKADPDAAQALVSGYVSYGGAWDLEPLGDGFQVVHHVAYALLPNWVGTDLIRRAEFDGDALVLTTVGEKTPSGKDFVNVLRWVRAWRGAA